MKKPRRVVLKHLAQKKEPPRTAFNARMSEEDMEIIREKARRFTGGNVSEWVRYAATHYEPAADELASPAE